MIKDNWKLKLLDWGKRNNIGYSNQVFPSFCTSEEKEEYMAFEKIVLNDFNYSIDIKRNNNAI